MDLRGPRGVLLFHGCIHFRVVGELELHRYLVRRAEHGHADPRRVRDDGALLSPDPLEDLCRGTCLTTPRIDDPPDDDHGYLRIERVRN